MFSFTHFISSQTREEKNIIKLFFLLISMPLHSLLPNEGLTEEFKILFFVIGDTLIYKVYVVKFTLS